MKTGIVYGSSTGCCEAIAEKIASKLDADVVNVCDLNKDFINDHDNLLLGTSTWGAGEMQDDWYDGVRVLKNAGLAGKTVAVFGCGDSEGYSDTFCGGMAELYHAAEEAGATMVGHVSTKGYNFDDSESVVNGEWIGLALDEVNEDDKTDGRIDNWVAAIKPLLK